jgi:hypothetical protein
MLSGRGYTSVVTGSVAPHRCRPRADERLIRLNPGGSYATNVSA